MNDPKMCSTEGGSTSWVQAALVALTAGLVSCGGREAPESTAAPAARMAPPAAAAAAPTISTAQLLDWAQAQFPTLFPAGPANQRITSGGTSYTYRFYPATGNYLGVGDADGIVYGLGDFTGQALLGFGAINDFACDVIKTCTRVTPDADGNLGAGGLRATDFSLRAGDLLTFDALTPRDAIIEVASPTLDSATLCTAPTLPAGGARAATVPQPLSLGPYAGNRFSGPYRSYPAGVFAMSVSSDECGFVERAGECSTASGETALARIARAGGVDSLCGVSPTLTGRPNAACVRGRLLDSTWADPGIQGVFLRLSWNDLQPSGYGQYDWTMVDRELAQAVRHGKVVTLGIRVGANSIPDWVFKTGHPQLGPAKPLQLRDWDTGADAMPDANCGIAYTVASPADAAYKALFKQALADLAAHLRADQRRFSMVAGVKVTGLAQHTLENRLPKRCNIARPNPALGDSGTQGHIVSLASASLANPVFEARYSIAGQAAQARVRDTSLCVCNPQVMAFSGYTPSTVVAFYNEIQATLREGFGHKQMIYMNLSEGFPRVGERGRFEGDHLVPPIVSASTGPTGATTYAYGVVAASPARSPADIPDANDITTMVIEAARGGAFAGGSAADGRQFGVENAALAPIGFATNPAAGNCSQQLGIATSGSFAGSAAFPIAASKSVDATGPGCPNAMATREGIAYDKVTGFQVVNSLQGAAEVDASLWNLTLNTNGLFYEYYETDAWVTRKQSAQNPGGVFDAAPAVQRDTGTANRGAATAKSGVQWNALLLARAAAFSADPRHANLFQADPFPAAYSVTVATEPGATRYVFNARACQAWAERGVPVRINRISIAN